VKNIMSGIGNYTGGLDGILNTNTNTLSTELRTYINGFG